MKNLAYILLLCLVFGVIVLIKNGHLANAERGEVQAAFTTNGGVDDSAAQVLDCYAQLESLPSSSTYRESDWEISFVQTSIESIGAASPPVTPNPFFDLNGDGLVDYVIKDALSSDVTAMCVYLNNGSGFDPAYRCAYDSGANRYYGDCAG